MTMVMKMDKNIETEFKIMLTKDTFDRINADHKEQTCYSQTNYYLTSEALSRVFYSFRLREKNGTYEMTLKTPTDGLGRVEINCPLSAEEFNEVMHGHLIDNEITQLLRDEGFNLDEIKQSYSLTTIRHDIPYQYGLMSLDENFYLNQHDYELEFELSDLEHGPDEFKEILTAYGLSYHGNCLSKIKRVLNALEL